MDIERLFQKIERAIGKELKFSMRECESLVKLRNDIKYLSNILWDSQEKKTVLLDYYRLRIKHQDRDVERIERRLNVWLRRLEKLLIKESYYLSTENQSYLEQFKAHLLICKNTLVRILAPGGELEQLISLKKPDWKKVDEKIEEVLGSEKNPGIKSLMAILNKLEDFEHKFSEARNRVGRSYGKVEPTVKFKDFELYGFALILRNQMTDLKKLNKKLYQEASWFLSLEDLCRKKLQLLHDFIVEENLAKFKELKKLLLEIKEELDKKSDLVRSFKERVDKQDNDLVNYFEKQIWLEEKDNVRADWDSPYTEQKRKERLEGYLGAFKEPVLGVSQVRKHLELQLKFIKNLRDEIIEQPGQIRILMNLVVEEISAIFKPISDRGLSVYFKEMETALALGLRSPEELVNTKRAREKIIDIYGERMVGFHWVAGSPIQLVSIFKDGITSEVYEKFLENRGEKLEMRGQGFRGDYTNRREVSVFNYDQEALESIQMYEEDIKKYGESPNLIESLKRGKLEYEKLADKKYRIKKIKGEIHAKVILHVGEERFYCLIVSPEFPAKRYFKRGESSEMAAIKYRIPPQYLIGIMVWPGYEKKALKVCKFFAVPLYNYDGKVIWPK